MTTTHRILSWQYFGEELRYGADLPPRATTRVVTDDYGLPMLLIELDGDPIGEAFADYDFVEHPQFGTVPLELDGRVCADFRAEALNRGVVVPEVLP